MAVDFDENDLSDLTAEDFEFDAVGFAEWFKEAFANSRFKSLTELAEKVGSNKATLSRLINASPQTLTEKPSRPRVALVLKIAEALGFDTTKPLDYAGYVTVVNRKPRNFLELITALENIGIELPGWAKETNFSDYTEDDFEELKQRIALDTDITIRRKKK